MEQLNQYLKDVGKNLKDGDSSEITYRTSFQNLINSYLPKGYTIKHEPAGREEGKPDFIISKDGVPVGIIETKDVEKKLAVSKSDKDQLLRYYNSMSNVILTDYLEFRWYARLEDAQNEKDNVPEPKLIIHLASHLGQGKLKQDQHSEEDFSKLLNHFLNAKVKSVTNATDLAQRMASIACDIRDSLLASLKKEGEKGVLHSELATIRKDLIHTITEEQFADMYAQTICYGLFAARIEAGGEITWDTAPKHIPMTNPFLRRVFNEFREILDSNVTWATDILISLLNRSDIEAILTPGKKQGFSKDPIFYFYEPFLTAYNPELREKRGVYYTPEPVVSYIVRSVDILLEEKFGMKQGLATNNKDKPDSPKLLILDPATGTGTFLYEVLNTIYSKLKTDKYGNPSDDDVHDNILDRIFGFELMMAPYSIAHLKLGLFLKQHGYSFSGSKRLNIFLTNTLEAPTLKENNPGGLFGQAVADEVNSASDVKKVKPIMVVLGNPPYSGHSANKDIEWINKLLKGVDTNDGNRSTANYFKVDGQDLGERNPKWLNDDYVRFIRWAQWRIENTGSGVLAFITNHGYLDNPTFRGMRQSLLETFDEIYVLDLHGNAKKKEACADGSKDENVFDIQQGVSIGLFVKTNGDKQPHPSPLMKGEGDFSKPSPSGRGEDEDVSSFASLDKGGARRAEGSDNEDENNENPPTPLNNGGNKQEYARVFHADLYGLRDDSMKNNSPIQGKYNWLREHDIKKTEWKQVEPIKPFYMLIPTNMEGNDDYKGWHSVVELMHVNSVGIVTSRDGFVFDYSEKELESRIKDFIFGKLDDSEAKIKYLSKNDKLDVSKVRKNFTDKNIGKYIHKCLYRPFDVQQLFYNDIVIERSRSDSMRHMLAGENLGLITRRQMIPGKPCTYFMISKFIISDGVIRSDNKGSESLFPLYLYPDPNRSGLGMDNSGWPEVKNGRRPNLDKKIVERIASDLGLAFIPDGKGNITQPHPSPLLKGEGDVVLPTPGEGGRRPDEDVSTFGPEDLFNYIYAVLHSPTYRTRYADFLKYDFPRIPFTKDAGLFRELAILGQKLASLHLLEDPDLDDTIASYPVCGSDTVEKLTYNDSNQRVYINADQYFDGIHTKVWEFMVGGYQVAQKWLKDRKGRKLEHGDRVKYCMIVTALSKTIKLMAQTDEVIENHGGWPLQ